MYIHICILDTPKKICTLSGYHDRTIFSVDWSFDDKYIVSSGADETIRIFQKETQDKPKEEGESYSQVCVQYIYIHII